MVTSLVWNMRPTVDAVVEAVAAGNFEASNLAEYLVPVNADAPDVTIEFVDVRSMRVNRCGWIIAHARDAVSKSSL